MTFFMFREKVWLQVNIIKNIIWEKGVYLVCKQLRYLVCERQ